MAAALIIAPATEADLPELLAIDRRCFPDPWPLEELAQELRRDFARLEVARVANTAQGAADGPAPRIAAFINYWLVHDEVQLIKIATHPEQLRRGLARQLVLGMLASAAALDMRSVNLEVRRSNAPAIALYRSFGFVEVGSRPRYYPDGTDALLMDLRLTDE